MRFQATDFPGLYVLTPKVFSDARGFFVETYSGKVFAEQGLDIEFVQDNHARSEAKGVLRGLHFQLPPMAQAKLVRVSRGAVYDVVVDLRAGSPMFGRGHAEILSAENFKQLLIPRGFAHAYLTLEAGTEFQYKVDAFYDPGLEAGLFWNDPDLKIEWPEKNPILSDKDKALPLWRDFTSPFVFEG